MKGYRTPIQKLKEDYARMLGQRRMQRQRESRPGYSEQKNNTPDNSEPFLSHPPASFADLVKIAKAATQHADECRQRMGLPIL